MKLTKKAREAIDNQTCRLKLALALDCSENTIRRYINNPESDELTKAAALKVIREATGLDDDAILEEIPEREVQS